MVTAGIVGGTGYTGVELLRLLARHPQVKLQAITSRGEAGTPVAELFPSLRGAGVFDMYTLHPGPGAKRLIGNLTAEWEGGTLAGFENRRQCRLKIHGVDEIRVPEIVSQMDGGGIVPEFYRTSRAVYGRAAYNRFRGRGGVARGSENRRCDQK